MSILLSPDRDCYALLNPRTACEPLFASLFEVVCKGQHKFSELALPSAQADSGGGTTFDGGKASPGHPGVAV